MVWPPRLMQLGTNYQQVNKMKSIELNKLLIEKFPNLADTYRDEVEWQEGDETGSHTVYGDVFTPYIVECIEGKKTIELVAVFDFIELVLAMKDDYANEVIAFSVIESIEYLLNENEEYKGMMGSITKNILEEL